LEREMAREVDFDWSDTATYAFDVVAAEFIVVTADGADADAYAPLTALLKRMRKALGVEFAFISEWVGGDPVVRYRAGESEADALQAEFGMRLLEESAGDTRSAFHAVAVVTSDGVLHGTLCCRVGAKHEADQATRALRSVARLMARWFEEAGLSLSGLVPLQGHSVMGSLPMSLH
jgi:hypothetical protein